MQNKTKGFFKNNKGDGKIGMVIVGIIVTVLFLIAIVPALVQLNADADNSVLECTDGDLPILDVPTGLCTNQTFACLNAELPTLNITHELCTNETGVGVINETPSSGVLLINGTREGVGLNATEGTLLGLVILFLIIGLIVFIFQKTGLKKS